MFLFKIFNKHEEGHDIVLYGCRYPKYPNLVNFDGPIKGDEFEQGAKASSPIAHRWRMNMKTGEATEAALDELNSEFPRVNERFTGAKTRYGYGVSRTWHSSAFLKYDFEKGTREKHELGRGHVAGEGVFVPRPDAKTEDDGWLVSLTHDRVEGRSELRVVDCRELRADPVVRVRIPQRVPYGFHVIWLPAGLL